MEISIKTKAQYSTLPSKQLPFPSKEVLRFLGCQRSLSKLTRFLAP